DADADRDRSDDLAAAPHGRAAALYGDWHDGRLRLDGHDEPAFLERQQLVGAAAGPFRKNQKGIAGADRRRSRFDRSQRRFLVATVHWEKTTISKRPHEDRNLVQLRLVQNVHHRVKRVVQDRWIDVALMIRAEDRGAAARQVLPAGDSIADPCEYQTELHAE